MLSKGNLLIVNKGLLAAIKNAYKLASNIFLGLNLSNNNNGNAFNLNKLVIAKKTLALLQQ